MPSRKNTKAGFSGVIYSPKLGEVVPEEARVGFVRMVAWHIEEASRESGCAEGNDLPENGWWHSWSWCDWLILIGPVTKISTNEHFILVDLAEMREVAKLPDGRVLRAPFGLSKCHGEN